MKPRHIITAAAVAGTAVTVAVVGTTLTTWLGYVAHWTVFPAALAVAIVATATITYRSAGWGYMQNHTSPALAAVSGVLCVALVAGAAWHLTTFRYRANDTHYVETLTAVDDDPPAFQERPPYPQAAGILPRRQGDLRGVIGEVTYVNKDGKGYWTALVDGEGVGRKATGVIEWNGKDDSAGNFRSCEFPEPVDALDGILWNSLVREFRDESGGRGALFDRGDAYGYCDGGDAVLIAPYTRISGWVLPHEVPGGVAVVSDGSITLDTHAEEGEYPGPVYPISLVARQQDALRSRGSFGDHWFRRDAFLEDGHAEFEGGTTDDEENPNKGNTGQFSLITEDGTGMYVTPLVPKRNGRQITAVATVDSGHVKAGEYNELRLHTLSERRKSNEEVVQDIEAVFLRAGIPNVTSFRIMEVTPRDPDVWVASIGKTLEVLYNVEIKPDGSTCIFDALSGDQLRCSSSSDTETPDPDGTGTPAPVPTGPLSDMTTDDLIDLKRRVDDEVETRLASRTAQG